MLKPIPLREEPLGHTLIRVLNAMVDKDRFSSIVYAETGTIRERYPDPGDALDARSTLAVALWAKNNRGLTLRKLVTIDLESKHLSICQEVLEENGCCDPMVVSFMQGEGASCLANYGAAAGNPKINLLLLDSASEPEAAMAEFLAIRPYLAEQAIVLIDDIGRNGVNKGKLVLEMMNKENIFHTMLARYVAVIPFGHKAMWVVDALR